MKKDIQKEWNKVKAAYANAKTDKENAAAAKLQHEVQDALSPDELKEFNKLLLNDTEALLHDGDEMITCAVKEKLGKLPEALSMAYISKTYFGKSASWLSQRINGNKVNGKVARFTSSDLMQLQHALHDIGNKLLAVSF